MSYAPSAPTRNTAVARTGARARRPSGAERRMRPAITTATARRATTVRPSRSGRTTSATNAGSEPVSANAFGGAGVPADTPWRGLGEVVHDQGRRQVEQRVHGHERPEDRAVARGGQAPA